VSKLAHLHFVSNDKAKTRLVKHMSSTSPSNPVDARKSVKLATNMLKAKNKGGNYTEEVEGWKLDSNHKHPDGSRTVKVKHENGAVQVHTNKNVKALQTLLQQRYKVKLAEDVEQFSFNDYLVAAIHMVGEDYAVELANYAYNLQDTSIFENLETEAFNASNVNATHAADVKAHHSAELKKKADAGDENAKKRMELIKKSREAKTAEFNSRMDSM
jgi:hypothetical protein